MTPVRIVVALVACVAVAAAELLPWVVAGAGTDASSYSAFEVWPLAIAELLAIAAGAGLAAAALLLRRPQLKEKAMVAAIVAVVLTGATIAALETTAMLIPDSVLPATLRRTGLDLGAGIGLWIACAAGLIAVLSLADWRFRPIEIHTWRTAENRPWALALLTLLALTILFGWLRYETWFDAAGAGEELGLAGWAAPWIGPLSLLAVWTLIAAIGCGLMVRTQLAGLLAAAGGWLVTLVAAIAIVAANAIGGLADLTDPLFSPVDPDFQVTLAAWFAFGVGLAAAAVGGWLVSLRPPTLAE